MSNETNIIFCGRPNYTGPKSGMFGLLHHGVLVEYSHDVDERVAYVKAFKPKHEVAIRLHNMIYLGGCQAAVDYEAKIDALDPDYNAKRHAHAADYDAKRAWADYKATRAERSAFYDEHWAKFDALNAERDAKVAPLDAEILAYIRTHIPDCAWDNNNRTLLL